MLLVLLWFALVPSGEAFGVGRCVAFRGREVMLRPLRATPQDEPQVVSHQEVVKSTDEAPPPDETKMDSTMSLVVVVYFLQGALSLARLATTYYLKDELSLSPAELGALSGVLAAPWVIKPLYGFLSDTRPIFGYRRKSYLAISGIVGSASFSVLALAPASTATVVAANTVASAAVAVSDVVADSIVVEESRTDAMAARYQSAAWASRYVGAIGASLVAGPALRMLGPRGSWLATAPLPLLVAGAATLVAETPGTAQKPESFMGALRTLGEALSSPKVLRPAVFIFLWQATPSCGSAFFVFSTAPQPTGLGFDPDFVGAASAAGSVASLAGVGLYNAFFKDAPMSRVILWTTIASALLGCAPLALVFHLNRDWGLDDRLFSVGDDVVQSALGEVGFLPLLVLAAKVCPPGIEGVLFAALMSVFNLGGLVSQEIGAALTSLLGVSQADFSNLAPLVVLCSASTLLPLLFLDWVREAEELPSAHAHLDDLATDELPSSSDKAVPLLARSSSSSSVDDDDAADSSSPRERTVLQPADARDSDRASSRTR